MSLRRDEKIIMGLFTGLFILVFKLIFALVTLLFQLLISIVSMFVKLPYHLLKFVLKFLQTSFIFVSTVSLFLVNTGSFFTKFLTRKDSREVFDSLCCIYLGTDTSTGMKYVGQTRQFSEERFLQHRKHSTGPFKHDANNVDWLILKNNINESELDYWESYFIGFYDSYNKGYNSNRGNDNKAYKLGCKKRGY